MKLPPYIQTDYFKKKTKLTPIILSLVAGDFTAGDFLPVKLTVVFLWKTEDLNNCLRCIFTYGKVILANTNEWIVRYPF